MSNPFDQFDAATPQGDSNPFDQFDAGKKKDSRSAVGEIANQFKAGILVDLPKMAGQALKYTSDPGNKVYEAGQGITDWADEQGKRPDLAPQEDQHNIVTNALASGARMIPQSIAPAAVVGAGIAALPASIPAAVGLGAASVLGAVPAAMSQGQETLEKAREKGIPEDQALAAARSNALIEGGGEALGTYAGGKLLGIAGKTAGKMFGRTAGDALADQTSTAITKPFLKQLGETALVETGTEIGQNAGEAAVENAYGIDSKTPYQAGKEAIAPTLGMTALLAPFGLAGFAHAGKQRGERTNALASAETTPEDRQKIAGEFAAEISKVDKNAAANFMANAQSAIDGKQALSIGESMFLPPVAAEETPAPLSLPAPTYTGTPSDQVMAAEVERQNQADAAQKSADALYAERSAFEQANAGIAATPAIPVVGPLSAAANIAVQSGAHASAVAQQAAAQAAQNTTPEGKAGTPAEAQPNATAPASGTLAGIAAMAPTTGGQTNAAIPAQVAKEAPQADAPKAGATAAQATSQGQGIDLSNRTHAQLNYLTQHGKPGFKEAAVAELAKRGIEISAPKASADSESVPALKAGNSGNQAPKLGDFIEGPNGYRIRIDEHKKGSNQLDPVADAGALVYEVRKGSGDANPLTMVLNKDGKLVDKKSVMNADGSSNGTAFVPPGAVSRGQLVELLQARAKTETGSAERSSIDQKIKDLVTRYTNKPEAAPVKSEQPQQVKGAENGQAETEVLKQPGAVSNAAPVEDPIGWTRMTTVEREALVARAGWAGKIRGMNLGGVRVATQAWDAITEANRAKLIAGNQNTIKNEKPAAATVSKTESVSEQAPIKKTDTEPSATDKPANRIRTIDKWTAKELQDRLDRGNLTPESEQRLRAELAKRPQPKQSTPQESPLMVGKTPHLAEPVTVRNGVVWVGEYPAIDYDTEADITVPDGATPQQIIDSLRHGGALGSRKVFGLKSDSAQTEAQPPSASPQHVENGKAESATAAVVVESLKKGAANSPLDLRQERDLLLQNVDSAIVAAPTAEEKSAWDRINKKIDLTNNMHVADTIGYRVFDVPGDGKFKVLNLKEALQRFRERIDGNPGFSKPRTPSPQTKADWQKTGRGGTEATIKEFIDDGELLTAVEYAKQIGKPLVFGQYQDGSSVTVYTDSKPFEHDGYDDFKMVSARAAGASEKVAWAVIDLGSGMTVSSKHPTRLKAIAETHKALDKASPEKLATAVKSAKANSGFVGTQEELEQRWTAWAERQEEVSQAKNEQEHRSKMRGATKGLLAETSAGKDIAKKEDDSLAADIATGVMNANDPARQAMVMADIEEKSSAAIGAKPKQSAPAAAENTEEAKTSTVDAKKEAKPEAKPDPKPKAAKAPKIETVSDMTQSLAKAGYGHGTLPMNRSEIRVGLNMSAPFSDQRFEAVINLRGGKWNVSEVEVPDLKSEGMRDAMNKFRADLADLNEGRYPDEEAKKPDSAKTADAGEELTYNKRNRRTGGLKWDDIKDRNAALRIKEVVKAKVYPKPDYQALVDGGMKDVVAHIVKQAYDSIAPSPKLKRGAEPTDEALQSYIAGVNRVMDGVMKWANDGTAVAKWAKAQSKLSGGSFSISELATAETLLDTVYPGGWKSYREEIIMMGGNKMLGALQPGHDEVGRAMKDIKLGWPAKSEAWQKQGYKVVNAETIDVELYAKPARGDSAAYVSGMVTANNQRIDSFMVRGTSDKESPEVQAAIAEKRKQLEGNYVLVDKSGRIEGVFPAEEPAIEAAREKVKRDSGEKIGEKGVSVETAERLGIEHRLPGDDVTSERLKETFGFRGVNFGNWMQGDTKAKVNERQLHLNHLFDAFMDLAQLLNLPPKALSLNGMLGIAVGAQGSGKALAHFVPGVNEINVTRTKGAGALAHEWGHALDHYFATMGGLDRKKEPYLSAHVGTLDGRVENGRYVRTPVALADVRPEIAGQFQSIVEAMTKRHETDAEYEARIRSEKAIAGRLVADEIKEIVASIGEAKTGWGTPELIAKVRGLAARIASLDYGEGRVSMGGTEVPAVVAEIADAYKESSGVPLKNVNALGYHADRYRVISGILESADGREPRTVPTDYKKASEAADAKKKPYWSTKLEMFARAFDAYVVDRLAEKAAKNSYLSGIEAVAPQGEERKAIGKAFDFLFAELKTKETEHGTAIYNIAGKDALLPADTAIYGMAAEGKSAEDILKFIGSASRNPFYRQLAKLLMKTGIAPTITVGDGKGWKFNAGEGNKYAAGYNPTTNTISLFRPASAERNMLHELMHAATLKALSGKGMASAQMKALFSHVEKTGRAHGLFYDKATKRGVYGMANVDEFIAEAFSNPKFQEQLKKVAAPTATGGKLSSAWDWFVRVVRGILGIPQGQENALSQALEIGVGVMRENMEAATTDTQTGYAGARGSEMQERPSVRAVTGSMAETVQSKVGAGGKTNAIAISDSVQASAIKAAQKVQDESNAFDLEEEIKSVSENGESDLSSLIANPKYWDAENEEFTDEGYKQVDLMNEQKARDNLRLLSITDLSDLDSAYHKAQYAAMVSILDGMGIEYKDTSSNSSKYLEVGRLKLRFANHANTTRSVMAQVSNMDEVTSLINVAPGEYKFAEALDAVMRENMKATAEAGGTHYAEGQKQTDNPAFRKWFGDSKVVDANGDPLVVYHGTGATDISEFKVSTSGTYGGGIYLTPEIRGANDYAIYRGAPNSTVYPVYAAIKNPASGSEAAQVASWKGEENAREELIKRGYDGVVDMRSGEIVAFYPEQIKSAIGNNGNFSPSNHDIRYNVADEGWSVAEPSKMDDVIYALQDKHIDTKRVMQAIMGAGKKIKDSFNPYLQEELFHGRSAKGVKDFLDFELRPLLKQMQDAKVDMGDFEEYLWNRHAEERNQQIAKINPDMQDGGSGIETATARAYLAGLGAEQRRTFESLAAKVEAMNKASQRVLVESGLEKQSTIDAWNGAYKHYVPLQREDVDNGHVGTGKGFSVRGSATKRAMGSGKNVVDIIANLTMQRERNIVRAEKNRVSNALMGLAVENPNKDFWTVDVAPKERVVEETAIYTVVDEGGAKLGEFTRMSEAEKLANKTPGSTIDQKWGDRVTERVVPGFKNRDNVLLTRVNGDDHYIIFNERDERAMRMATAMKNMDVDNLGRVLSLVGRATRYLSAINTQYNPVFGVINLIRDAQGALLNLSSTPLAGEQKRVMAYTKDALVGIYKDIRAHRAGLKPSSNWASLFEEFQREGGATGYRDQYANAEARAEAIKSELEQFKEGKAKQLTRGLFGWLSDYNETMENAVRLASYKAAIEKGMSKAQAASLAKNITVNFNRKGQMATQVGSLYAFFNASVQGTARIAGTLFDMKDGDIKTARLSKTGKKIVYGGIMLGSMQALLLAAAGFGDDEPPDFIKERNLILPIGDGKYLTLAMPLGYHVFPGIGRLATEFVLSGGKDPLKKIAAFGSMFAEALNPIGNSGFSLQTITPSVIDPLAALAENRDFTGKEIYQNDFNKLNPTPGFTRAKDTATAWSKAIAEGLNFITGGTDYKPGLFTPTPDQIDYLIGQVTGGVGREVGKVSQVVSATTTGEDLPIYKVPLVGRFVGDTQGKSGESAKFYNSLREINMHEAEYKGLIGDGKRQEAAEYLAENPAVKLIMLGNQSERAVKKLKEAKRNLIENDAPQEKVAAMEDQIAKSMKLFNDRVTKALAQ